MTRRAGKVPHRNPVNNKRSYAQRSTFRIIASTTKAKLMTDHESELTPEDEQCKEVYAQYGLAAYFAQCFEKGMINFLFFRVFTEKPDAKIDKLNIDDFLDDYERTLHKKTLGYLLKKSWPDS